MTTPCIVNPFNGSTKSIEETSVLSDIHFRFLEQCLRTRPILYPKQVDLAFSDGYRPLHLKCYRTARKVEQQYGLPVIAGITFLEKGNKLFPWPHMVNAMGFYLSDGLIDASPKVAEPNLGFAPIRLNETVLWNEITKAYSSLDPNYSTWGDESADNLSSQFLSTLRLKAGIATSETGPFTIPDSIPDLSGG